MNIKNLNKNFLFLALIIIILFFLLIYFNTPIKNYVNFVGKTILGDDCSNWSECYFNYTFSKEIISDGEQKRRCIIDNSEKIERRKCELKNPIVVKKIDDYLELVDLEGNLVSKIQIDENRLDIEF